MSEAQTLSDAVRAARVRAGYAKRAAFARELGIDDSTLAIIEGARPGSVSDDMLDFVTMRLGWAPGHWRGMSGAVTEADSSQRYTLDQARRIIERQNREEQCQGGRHAPSIEFAEAGKPASDWLCDCGRFRYHADEQPLGQHGPTADYGEG